MKMIINDRKKKSVKNAHRERNLTKTPNQGADVNMTFLQFILYLWAMMMKVKKGNRVWQGRRAKIKL